MYADLYKDFRSLTAMNMQSQFEKLLGYVANGQIDKAVPMFKKICVAESARATNALLESDEDIADLDREFEHGDMGGNLADEISDDKDEIETEELFDEEGMDGEESVDDHFGDVDFDEDNMDVDDVGGDVDELTDQVADLEGHVDDIDDDFAAISAEFEKIKNGLLVDDSEGEDEFGDEGEEDFGGELDGDGEEELGDDASEEEFGSDDFGGDTEEADEDDFGSDDDLEESFDLDKVAVSKMTDEAPGKGKSPVANPAAKMDLGGKPVKIVDKGHKGFERETKLVDKYTKHTNVLPGKASAALTKVSVDSKDKAPGAGPTPSASKGRGK